MSKPHVMLKYLYSFLIFLLPAFSFSQIFIEEQNETEATMIGLDRKNWNMGSTAGHSEGYHHDFMLPLRENPCQKIVGITVDIVLNGYTNNNVCPHTTLFYNCL